MVFFAFILSFSLYSGEQSVTFEPYQARRDRTAVQAIITDNKDYIAYESIGLPEGTTMKYIESSKYLTYVVRMDDRTVGFVNFIAYNITFFTFHFQRVGLIHLIGIAKDLHHRGIGKFLMSATLKELHSLNAPLLLLNVRRDNSNARALYEKFGFKHAFFNEQEFTMADITYRGNLSIPIDPADIIYMARLSIPADRLPQGNSIQRNPRTTVGIVLGTVGAYYAWKIYKKL